MTIDVAPATYSRILNYAKQTGQPASAVANEALIFWMDALGDAHLEAIDQKGNSNLVLFPAPAS